MTNENVAIPKTKEIFIPINEEEGVSGVLSIPKGYQKGLGKAVILLE